MNEKQLRKLKLTLIAQRRALLEKVDAIYEAIEASATKQETAEQTTLRKAHLGEIDALDLKIEQTDERIERAQSQTALETRSGSGRTSTHAGDTDEDDENGEDDDTESEQVAARERLEELEERSTNGGRLTKAERKELKTLRAEAATRRTGNAPRTLSDRSLSGGLSRNDLRTLQGFSFLRAFNECCANGRPSGLELEMHQEGEKEYRNANIERNGGNLIVPQLILRSAGGLGSFELRDVTATGTTSTTGDQGGVLIATQLGSLIDRLRKKLIMAKMGVTMLGGLQGNIDIPKVTPDDQAVEKAENATSAESSVVFSKISMAPRRLPIFAEMSRQLLLQSSTDVEAWIRNDLAFQIAQVMDLRSINGSGSGQPYGILNTTGVGAVALGTNGLAPTWDMLVDMETTVAALDADVGSLGYVFNTKTRGKFKKTLIGANTAAEMIWDKRTPGAPLNEYTVGITNQMPSNLTKGTASGVCSAGIFGNFNDALMGQWGGLEFLVNPYSKDTEGLIRVNAWTFYDFLVRRVESFCVVKDILTT